MAAILALLADAPDASAQGSLSGLGFGYPTGQLSTRAMGLGGSTGELDPVTPRNPASLSSWGRSGLHLQYDPEYKRVSAFGGADRTLEARFPVQRAGTYLGAVRLPDGAVLPLAPISLPYSPEFEPRPDPQEGYKTLTEMARTSGGVERTGWDDAFSPAGLRDRQIRDLLLPLTLLVLLLHVGEIAGRRLLAFATASQWIRTRRLPSWRRARVARPASPATTPVPTAAGTTTREPQAAPVESAVNAGGSTNAGAAPTGSPPSVESSLARAKARARARLGE